MEFVEGVHPEESRQNHEKKGQESGVRLWHSALQYAGKTPKCLNESLILLESRFLYGKNRYLGKTWKKGNPGRRCSKRGKKDPKLLPEIFTGISAKKARIRYGCAKILRIISKEKPEELYPRMDFFTNLLDSDKRILKWNALHIIANLARVDVENRFNDIFDRYYGLLNAEYMVTVATVVTNSGKIAKAKPHLIQRITNELLKTENLSLKPHLTQECKNIILGFVISVFDTYFDQIEIKDEVISFAKRQLNNTRNATKVKAGKFLEKIK